MRLPTRKEMWVLAPKFGLETRMLEVSIQGRDSGQYHVVGDE
jgi:hypothetical protein